MGTYGSTRGGHVDVLVVGEIEGQSIVTEGDPSRMPSERQGSSDEKILKVGG